MQILKASLHGSASGRSSQTYPQKLCDRAQAICREHILLQMCVISYARMFLFCCCDLDLDLMTFDLDIPKIYTYTKNEVSRSRLSKVNYIIMYRVWFTRYGYRGFYSLNPFDYIAD